LGNFQYMYNLESLKESGAKSRGKIFSCVWRKIRVLTLFYMGDLEIVVLHVGGGGVIDFSPVYT
jgi:hypothetical protein